MPRGTRSDRKAEGARRNTGGRADGERGRRSRARLGTSRPGHWGRTFETVTEQPRRVKVDTGLLRRWGGRPFQAVGLTLIFVLGAMLCYLFSSPLFFVWEAEVIGTRWLNAEQVYSAAGVEGYSIFYIDPRRVSAVVERLPSVARAQIICGLPARVVIRVEERQPAAIWQAQGIQYWVDHSGVLFPRAADLEDPVIIVDQGPADRAPGQQVDARAVVAATGLNNLVPGARIFGYTETDGLSFDLPSGQRVLVPVDCEPEKVAASVTSLQTYMAQEGIAARLIDLRYRNRAVWR